MAARSAALSETESRVGFFFSASPPSSALRFFSLGAFFSSLGLMSGASAFHLAWASASSAFHAAPTALPVIAKSSFFVASGFAASTSALTAARFSPE